ncbi:hypothetical protein MKX53_17525 [Psychrobacillus sp. FSL K6-4615]|uniref:hypothetical protein n=1 Tax=Psychrobacillus sp. FSL K6-4615 TaxID=2921551 RepID=UPI0030F9AA8B
MEINQETQDKLQAIAKSLAKVFNEIFEYVKQFAEWIKNNWSWLKEKCVELYQLEEKKQKATKNQHHLNFSRKKITHQVIDRRPKQMIRKIIH